MASMRDNMRLASMTVRAHAHVRPGERVLILSDTRAERCMVESLCIAAEQAGGMVTSLCVPWKDSFPHAFFVWDEPASHAAAAMLASDVIISYGRSMLAMTETARQSCKRGARVLWMTAEYDYLRPLIWAEDYSAIAERVKRIAGVVRKATEVHVTTAAGTDLRCRLSGRPVIEEDGTVELPGESDFFPGGAWQTSPLEASVQGVVVYDGTLQGIGALASEMRVEFVDGWITRIEGEKANQWRLFLENFGEQEIYRFSHIGGGLARHAQLIGTDWEDLLVCGSIIVAGGENVHMDGDNRGRAHFDGTVQNATVELDGEVLLEAGEYVHRDLRG